ncbi:hypothetical protein HAX54_001194 [Datura stramonium]|uniref:Uncharacterized protein n=1 Tax=Datura stramonium TaxID=4076 RepID=A0ABS8T313_DATST|nr:hypothetical protein [Datura stramonium]
MTIPTTAKLPMSEEITIDAKIEGVKGDVEDKGEEKRNNSKKWGDMIEEEDDERRDTYKEGGENDRKIVTGKSTEPTGEGKVESSNMVYAGEGSTNMVEMPEDWEISGTID